MFKLNTLNLQLMLISRSAVMDHSPNISPEFDQNSLAQFWHWGGIFNTKDITKSFTIRFRQNINFDLQRMNSFLKNWSSKIRNQSSETKFLSQSDWKRAFNHNMQQIWQINWEPTYQQFAEAQRTSRHMPRRIDNNSFDHAMLDFNCFYLRPIFLMKMLINYLAPNNSSEELNQYQADFHEEIKEEKRFDEM